MNIIEHLRDALEHDIPTSWLDPLLSGTDAIVKDGESWTGRKVERLLEAIRDRLRQRIGRLTKDEIAEQITAAALMRAIVKIAPDEARKIAGRWVLLQQEETDALKSFLDYLRRELPSDE